MKVLLCTSSVPYPPDSGLKLRVYNLARELARDHDTYLFCLSEKPVEEERLRVIERKGIQIRVLVKPRLSLIAKVNAYLAGMLEGAPPWYILSWTGRVREEAAALARTGRFDVAVAEHLFMARYLSLLTIPLVLDAQNVEGQLAAAIARGVPGPAGIWRRLDAAWAQLFERRMVRRLQGVTAVSESDASRFRAMVRPGTPVDVVENGVRPGDYEEIALQKQQSGAPGRDLLFIGFMSYEPNAEAAVWFSREVMPAVRSRVPGAVFNIVGGGAPASVRGLDNGESVRVHGYAADIKPFYLRSSLLVVPLRTGGGSRLKILEAFAAGTPVVSTPKGAEGLSVTDGRHLLLADTPEEFAAAIGRILSDPELYARISREALALARDRYDWRVLGRRFAEDLLKDARADHAGS